MAQRSTSLLVASEYGEPSNHSSVISQRLFSEKSVRGRDVCLLLIAKNLPGCVQILDMADALKIPAQIHCTITGLGGTPAEPHIPLPDYVLEQSVKMIKERGIDPLFVTVRVDPLVPELLDRQMDVIPRVLETFAKAGVRDCRASVVDYYPHVRAKFDQVGMNHPVGFQPSTAVKELAINMLFHLTARFNMNLHLCAESIPQSLSNSIGIDIDTEGCASRSSWERLGITGLKPLVRSQRRECTCDLYKEDLLKGLRKGCQPGCIYCYWRQ